MWMWMWTKVIIFMSLGICTHFVSCRMGMMPCITRFSVSMKIYSRKSMNVPKHARVFKYVHSLINFDR